VQFPDIQYSKRWILVASLIVCGQILLSLRLPHSFVLTAFGDVTQCILLMSIMLAVLPNVTKSEGKTKLFWALMLLGFGMWLWSQVLWTYFEVFLRQEIPNPFLGDVILFLHVVPMMAALAVQPHVHREDHSGVFGSLDFLLLLVWWLYLFLFVVIPWQYVYPTEAVYGHSFDLLYFSEHVVFLSCLGLVWRRSAESWRTIYAQLFGAALLYAISSIAAGMAIDFHRYYTGSLYDIPLVAAMAWFAAIGSLARRLSQKSQPTQVITAGHGIWSARLAMLAVFSTPLMIAWAVLEGNVPPRVRTYRLLLTAGTMLVMGLLVFLKQHLLDQQLIQLLQASHRNLEEVSRLKDDLVEKEKLLRWQSMELQRKNVELQEVSFTDSLTRVWNRRFLEQTLPADAEQVLRSYYRAQQSAAEKVDHRDLVFMMVDVDFFKHVNDEHGHAAGDKLLERFAKRLSKVMRKSDVLVRWGGEEFLIMSRSADISGIPVFCSRILEVVAAEAFDLGNGIRVHKTCSIGWAPYPWCRSGLEVICAEEVIELADTALYRAKRLGRDQCVGFLPSDAAIAASEKLTMDDLRNEHSGLIKVIRTPSPGNTKPSDCPANTAVKAGKK
jgi:diguanylate cyclase (GGDEF)-like protein